MQTQPRPAGRARDAARGVLAPLLCAVVAVALVWLLWRMFVLWPTGQLIDDAAWRGSSYRRDAIYRFVAPVVRIISEPFLVVAALGAFAIAALQRRWSIAVTATVLLAGANLTTQFLKDYWLVRPDFGLTERPINSLPSGHATAAAAVAATALLIAPARWRGPIAIVGSLYAGATGIGTLVLGWHRPSDVLASYAVVAAWYFVAEAARSGRLRPLPRGYGDAPPGNASVWLWFLGGLGVVIGVVGIVLTFTQVPGVDARGQAMAYLTAAAGIAGTAAFAGAAMLGMRPYSAAARPTDMGTDQDGIT